MTTISISEAIHQVNSWIESCTTHEQLVTCERFIGQHIAKRWPEEQLKGAIGTLVQSLQLQRLYIQAFGK